MQWAVRPVTIAPHREALGEELPVHLGSITVEEVRSAAKGMKDNRSAWVDDIPAEFWKALLATDNHYAVDWIMVLE